MESPNEIIMSRVIYVIFYEGSVDAPAKRLVLLRLETKALLSASTWQCSALVLH